MKAVKAGIGAVALSVVLAIVLAGCGGGGSASSTEVTTDSDGFKTVEKIGMELKWKFSGDNLEIVVHSPENGWIGVGFDPQTIMKGANLIIGYVSDGNVNIADHYADQLTNHHSDESLGGTDDVTVIDGSENSSGTTLHFTIPADSGDQFDKALAPGEKHKIMLAHSPVDDFTTGHKETSRTVFEVTM